MNRRMIIALMHSLPSVGPLLQELANYAPVLFVPKNYSKIAIDLPRSIGIVEVPYCFISGHVKEAHSEVLRLILRNIANVDHYVLLDSGGLLTEEFDGLYPNKRRTSIQLTQSGCRKPIRNAIMLGALPEKKAAESRAICEAILSEATKMVDLNEAKIGVVGKGAIGQGVAELLPGSIHFDGLEIKPERVDILFGATGYDTSNFALETKAKHLFSCSSWDVEFNTILRKVNKMITLDGNCDVKVEGVTIYNAGCPVNFNRCEELEPYSAMQYVRELTLKSALGALKR